MPASEVLKSASFTEELGIVDNVEARAGLGTRFSGERGDDQPIHRFGHDRAALHDPEQRACGKAPPQPASELAQQVEQGREVEPAVGARRCSEADQDHLESVEDRLDRRAHGEAAGSRW